MSHSFDELARAYERQVRLPWRSELSPAERVWILWYDKSLDRRVAAQVGVFENATRAAGHGWTQLSFASLYGSWIGGHRLFKPLLRRPNEMLSVLPEFEAQCISEARNAASLLGPHDVLAISGTGALFGVASVSRLIEGIAPAVSGRLLVLFPGRYEGGRYRLLDARDGWNYHAIPIPAQPFL